MKKYFLFTVMTALFPSMAVAQLKVNSGGYVGIGHSGNDQSKLIVTSNNSTSTNNFGILSAASNSSNATVKSTVGVNGFAIGKNGYTYGVVGRNLGSYNQSSNHFGTGILGVASFSHVGTPYIEGYYAGYFVGNVKVTGTIDGTLISSSDGQLKENVEPLADGNTRGESTLTKLGLLTPVSYNYKDTTAAKSKIDHRTKIDRKDLTEEDEEFWDELFEEEIVEEPNQVMEKRHFGFIAQELQEVYPDLVYQKDDGYLAVNYTELIPILVQSIKELNEKVEVLSGNTTKRSMAAKSGSFDETASMDALDLTDVATMNQNVPNPFSEKTDIAIYLPETVKTATLYIYDLSGKQLEQYPIKGRGNTVMTIHADRMDAGMYVYSLIADKKVVTTKKMIVVK